MKIIHTADWHLGRIINGKSLLEDQAYILEQFIREMEQQHPDVIVIAGDLYDTSYPNKEAILLLEHTIKRLNLEMGIAIIMISGNHDSKERLQYGATWFERSNLYIRTHLDNINEAITIGDVDFYTLPFATINETQQFFNDERLETHQQCLSKSLSYINKALDKEKLNILIGHLTVQGGLRSDSERPLTIGTVESVEAESFKQFDRVLLGHLHHPFSIQSDYISYSGSLLQYSFSETKQPKGYKCIEIESGEIIKEKFIPMQPLRKLEVVNGDYEAAIQEKIDIESKENYLHFKLKHMSHVSDPMMHLKQIYPNTLALTNQTFDFETPLHERNEEIQKMNDEEIISHFYEYITDESLSETQNSKLNSILNDMLQGGSEK
ncbi:exonuclease SbcCD subunit D [Staphylococcus sp. ACRSN]|uniref:exonuclease subunit SbcD n=1 Tax=Staphylococcus sp. ACRSN TaxID=2918214 RepID=UPI001EF20D9C|nr:exonuclease subunit SbcD [Staphylococcus sp. ACRSN]MCG7339544.1 exonuclease SbcCD subunit D [Staphylococcus sp. ACRSN]